MRFRVDAEPWQALDPVFRTAARGYPGRRVARRARPVALSRIRGRKARDRPRGSLSRMALAAFDRADALRRLGAEQFDVLVIGGGITGAGVALDAASRGLSTALVERDDFASGTSSKSSKLVHGGLRYLQHHEFRLVYENLYERQIALRNAPHLVRILPFLIPILSKDGLLNSKLARGLGSVLWMYDLTGGLRIGKVHRRIKKEAAVEHMPTLRAPNVAAAYIYYDAQTDDARLTLTIARTAASRGAVVANHVGVTGLRKDGAGRIIGATVDADGESIDIDARVRRQRDRRVVRPHPRVRRG